MSVLFKQTHRFPFMKRLAKLFFYCHLQQQKQGFHYPPCNDNISPPWKRKIIANRRGRDSSHNTYCSKEENSKESSLLLLGKVNQVNLLPQRLQHLCKTTIVTFPGDATCGGWLDPHIGNRSNFILYLTNIQPLDQWNPCRIISTKTGVDMFGTGIPPLFWVVSHPSKV